MYAFRDIFGATGRETMLMLMTDLDPSQSECSLPFDLARNEIAMAGSIDDDVIGEILREIVIPLFTACSRGE